MKRGETVLDFIWAGLMLLSLLFGVLNGQMAQVTNAVFSGASSAVTVCISLAGSLCLWSGMMRIAEQAGVSRVLARILRPLLRRLFPELPDDSAAARAICMNLSANILGLGNAATPFGIAAMKEMNRLNDNPSTATHSMITFVVLNTASLQLVPSTIAMLRSQYSADNPLDILPAMWITALCALTVGLSVDFLLRKRQRLRGEDP